MAIGELTFRRYRSEDFNEYAEVYEAVYGKAIDREFFAWKNLQNPVLAGEALIYLALDEGRIIGANSFFPSILEYQGQTYRAVQSGDTMVLPSHRGRGVFLKILAYASDALKSDGYAGIYGYANGNSYPGFLKFGFSDLGRIHLHYRILNWHRFLLDRGMAWGLAGTVLDKVLLSWRTMASLPGLGSKGYAVKLLQDEGEGDFSENLAEGLAKGVGAGTQIHSHKDKAYLEWKYRNKPNGEYRGLAINKDGELVGLFVIRIDRHGEEQAGEVVEHFLASQHEAVPVIRVLLDYLRQEQFAYLKVWDPNDEALKKAFKMNLFFEREVALYFIVKVLQEGMDFLTDRSCWKISGGDADTA